MTWDVMKWTIFSPIYIPYFFTLKPLLWVLGKVFGLPMWVLSKIKPTSRVGKAIYYAFWVWFWLPGTNVATIYWLATKIGYEKEAEAALNWAVTAGGWVWETAKVGFALTQKVVEMAMMMV